MNPGHESSGAAKRMNICLVNRPSVRVPLLHAQNPEHRPRDDRDAIKDIARDLMEIASHIGQLKGDANAYLTNPNYNRLKRRLENALSLCGGGRDHRG
jgi:hypothetical protein